MKLPRKTKDFMQNGAPKGERNQSVFDAACQLRDAGIMEQAALTQLVPTGMSSGLAESEVRHTVVSAYKQTPRSPIIKEGRKYVANPPKPPTNKIKHVDYDLKKEGSIPNPLPDPTRSFLRAAFVEGEGVSMEKAKLKDDDSEYPPSSGTVLSREEWLRKCDENNGVIPYITNLGVFIRINPMKIGSGRDTDVTQYRHALIEFDNMSKSEQWQLINQSKIPCTAILDSGNKSLHAWVRVNAKDEQEYDQRVRALYDHFEPYGLDPKNKNPSRFSRLPGKSRREGMQSLLALHTGASSFTEWLMENSIDSEVAKPISIRDLALFNPENDENSILGNRWLCKGGSCLWVGSSGIGKSSLQMQAAITWGFGKSFFGIYPRRPLKSLIIQAENDFGDVAEQLQGVANGMGFDLKHEDTLRALEEKVILSHEESKTSDDFAYMARKLIERHQPDIVWVDPLLTYLGGDISSQEVVSRFLRNLLNPISKATGVVWMMIHHTGKPSKDSKAHKNWSQSDYAYYGIGSSELTNWARSVVILKSADKKQTAFELIFAKRGTRTGITDEKNEKQTKIYIQHSTAGICWVPSTFQSPDSEPSKKFTASKISIEEINSQWSELLTATENVKVIAAKMNVSAATVWRKIKSTNQTEDNHLPPDE